MLEKAKIDFSKLEEYSRPTKRKKSSLLGDIATGLIDWKFEHHVTPSIIRFTWIVLMVSGVVALCWTGYRAMIAARVQSIVDAALKDANVDENSIPSQAFQVAAFQFGPLEIAATLFVVVLLSMLWLRVAMERMTAKQ